MEVSGSCCTVGRRVGNTGIRCDVAHSPRCGRTGAEASVVGARTGSTLQHRERSCVSTLAPPSPAVLGCALVSGARH